MIKKITIDVLAELTKYHEQLPPLPWSARTNLFSVPLGEDRKPIKGKANPDQSKLCWPCEIYDGSLDQFADDRKLDHHRPIIGTKSISLTSFILEFANNSKPLINIAKLAIELLKSNVIGCDGDDCYHCELKSLIKELGYEGDDFTPTREKHLNIGVLELFGKEITNPPQK